jgi:hypothetical protein
MSDGQSKGMAPVSISLSMMSAMKGSNWRPLLVVAKVFPQIQIKKGFPGL